jgi:hypothetical protein
MNRIPRMLFLIAILLLAFRPTLQAANLDPEAAKMRAALLQALSEERGPQQAPEVTVEQALARQLSIVTAGVGAKIQCRSGDGDVCTCTSGCWATADRCACA